MSNIVHGSVGGDYRKRRGCAGLRFQILHHKVDETFESEENLMTLRMPKAACLQAISTYSNLSSRISFLSRLTKTTNVPV